MFPVFRLTLREFRQSSIFKHWVMRYTMSSKSASRTAVFRSFILAAFGSSFLIAYFKDLRPASLLIFFAYFCLFYLCSFLSANRKMLFFSVSLGLLFSVSIVFGLSYDQLNSYSLVFKNRSTLVTAALSVLSLTGFSSCILSLFFSGFLSAPDHLSNEQPAPKYSRFFPLFVFCILVLGSVPYLILYCPGLNIYDTHDQLLQFFGYPSYVGDGTVLSDHHPVLLTVIYGLFIRLGIAAGNASIGQFLYSLTSLISISLCYTVAFTRLRRYGLPFSAGIVSALFLAIWPVTATYAFNMCKDISVVPFILLFGTLLIDLHHQGSSCFKQFSYSALFSLCSLMIMLLRKSAFAAMVFTFLCFLITYKQVRRQIFLIFSVSLGTFILYNSVLLPALHVQSGESREMFSIPFQQTARYLLQYPEDVSQDELDKLSGVIDLNTIQNYDPRLADPIKDYSKPNPSRTEYVNYFKTWLAMGLRHPGVYLDAWLNMIYGYFYPSESNTILCLTLNSPDKGDLVLKQKEEWQPYRLQYHNFVYYTLRRLPGIGMLLYVPCITWGFLIVLCLLVYKFSLSAIVPWSFFIAAFGICLLSPKSGEIRYLIPILYVLPLIICTMLTRKDRSLQ